MSLFASGTFERDVLRLVAALCGDVARQTLGGTVGETVGSLLTLTGNEACSLNRKSSGTCKVVYMKLMQHSVHQLQINPGLTNTKAIFTMSERRVNNRISIYTA